MRIGELAAQLNLNAQTIRYYERIGLFPAPERTESGYRVYGPADERRLRFIKSARSTGLTLREVKEVLALHERGELPCAYVTQTLADRAEAIGRQIAELVHFKDELDLIVAEARARSSCELPNHGYCGIIEKDDALSRICSQCAGQTCLASEGCC